MKHIVPQEINVPWWNKYQAQIEFEIRLTPGSLSIKDWLFKTEAKFERTYRGYNCFWPRASIRVLGVFLGAALFLRGNLI